MSDFVNEKAEIKTATNDFELQSPSGFDPSAEIKSRLKAMRCYFLACLLRIKKGEDLQRNLSDV